MGPPDWHCRARDTAAKETLTACGRIRCGFFGAAPKKLGLGAGAEPAFAKMLLRLASLRLPHFAIAFNNQRMNELRVRVRQSLCEYPVGPKAYKHPA